VPFHSSTSGNKLTTPHHTIPYHTIRVPLQLPVTSHSFEWRISLEKALEKDGSLSGIEPLARGFKTQHKPTELFGIVKEKRLKAYEKLKRLKDHSVDMAYHSS